MITHEVSSAFMRVVDGADYWPIVVLRYRMEDPYVVRMSISDPVAGEAATWDLSRDLLKSGIVRRTGIADVVVQPYYNDPVDFARPTMVHIHLRSDDGAASLRFPEGELRSFLSATADVVPYGRESDHLDIDKVLRHLMAGHQQFDGDGG